MDWRQALSTFLLLSRSERWLPICGVSSKRGCWGKGEKVPVLCSFVSSKYIPWYVQNLMYAFYFRLPLFRKDKASVCSHLTTFYGFRLFFSNGFCATRTKKLNSTHARTCFVQQQQQQKPNSVRAQEDTYWGISAIPRGSLKAYMKEEEKIVITRKKRPNTVKTFYLFTFF